MIQTGFELPKCASIDLNSGRMELMRDSQIELIHCKLELVSDLSFVI